MGYSREIEVSVQGIDAYSDFNSYVNAELDQLLQESPSDASISALFQRQSGVTSGSVSIRSSQGMFEEYASGPDSFEVVHHILDSLRRRLIQWKRARRKQLDEDLNGSILDGIIKEPTNKPDED